MVSAAGFMVLLSAITKAMAFVNVCVVVYSLIIFIYVLSSWIPLPYNQVVIRVRRFLFDACEPYLRLFRRVLPPIGAFDLSPIVAVTVLWVIGWLVNTILAQFE